MFFCARRCFFLEQVAAVVKPISLVLKVDATMENLLAVEVASQVRVYASSVRCSIFWNLCVHLLAFTYAVLTIGHDTCISCCRSLITHVFLCSGNIDRETWREAHNDCRTGWPLWERLLGKFWWIFPEDRCQRYVFREINAS